jgi:hypothetical protein
MGSLSVSAPSLNLLSSLGSNTCRLLDVLHTAQLLLPKLRTERDF